MLHHFTITCIFFHLALSSSGGEISKNSSLVKPDFATMIARSRKTIPPYAVSETTARTASSHGGKQRRLINFLLKNGRYDNRVPPTPTYGVPINVTHLMNLYQIVDVVERSQHVVLYTWMTQLWQDELLRWNPEDFGNITSIVLPYTDVWLPDTYLYNNLQMARESSERWIKVIVEMDMAKDPTRAFMTFRYPAIYQFTCHMNVKYFPFDKQKCTMVFGSWTYDATGIDFFAEKEEVAREDFTESEEWALISFRARKVYEKYACCPHPFALLFYDLVIQRRPLHYIINLIIPTMIISLISNVGFFMPASTSGDRTEKISLGITTLLAMSILLLMVSDSMPTTSSTVPLIGWFLIGIMAQTSVATGATAFILIVHLRGRQGLPVPSTTRRFFFGWVNWILNVDPPFEESDFHEDKFTQEKCNHKEQNALNGDYPQGFPTEDAYYPLHVDDSPRVTPRSYACKSRAKSQDVQANLCIRGPIRKQSTVKFTVLIDPRREWEWLALILDRFCLVLSFVSIIALALGIGMIGYLRPQAP